MRTDQRSAVTAGLANVAVYDAFEDGEYLDGAPHLKHARLRALYADLSSRVLTEAARHRSPPRVLDLGAGEGSATIPFLQGGAEVTAIDASERQLAGLRERCADYAERLTVRSGDAVEQVRAARERGETYDLVVANSFLHHVPDHDGLVREVLRLLSAGGILFSFQDPLRYRTLPPFTRAFAGVSYLSWRLSRPGALGGIARRLRRLAGVYRDDCPYDNAEYHVVRGGVDQESLAHLLANAGLSVELVRYFSTQSAWWQRVGEGLGVENTFAMIARR